MMTPCQLSTFSEFICGAFHFQGHIDQKISKCMKNNKRSQKGLKLYDVALNHAFWTHKISGVQISSKKWNPFVRDEFPYETLILRKRLFRVSVWKPDTSKEIARFVDEVHPVFVVTLSTFLNMLCGWNDYTMPTLILFRVHLKCFSISGSFSSNIELRAKRMN